jgi:hypothetical protein
MSTDNFQACIILKELTYIWTPTAEAINIPWHQHPLMSKNFIFHEYEWAYVFTYNVICSN